MKKAVWILVVSLFSSLTLISCGRQQEVQDDYVYVAEHVVLSGTNLSEDSVKNLRTSGGWVYYRDANDGGIYRVAPLEDKLDLSKGEAVLKFSSLEQYNAGFDIEAGEGFETGGGQQAYASYRVGIANYTVDEEQSIYFIVSVSGSAGVVGRTLVKWSADGEEIYRTDISGMELGYDVTMAVDGVHQVYLLGSDSIYIVDKSGKPEGAVSVAGMRQGGENAVQRLLAGGQGDVFYCLEERGIQRSVWLLTGEKGFEEIETLTKPLRITLSGDILLESGNGLLYVDEGGIFYRYLVQTDSLEELLSLEESSLSVASNVTDVLFVDGDHLLVRFSKGGSTGDEVELYLLTRTAAEELPQKEKLVLVSASPTEYLKRAVAEFNRESGQYSLEIQILDETGLDSALAAGTPPDLIDMTWYSDIFKYVERNVLEDLTPYLEGSGVLDREDFLENALKGYTLKERLVGIPANFVVSFVSIRESYLDNVADWNMDALKLLAVRYPEEQLLNEDQADRSLLELCLPYILDHFVDWEEGGCSFDSDEFKELTTWIKEHSHPREEQFLWDETIVFLEKAAMEPSEFAMSEVWTGEKTLLLGYPGEKGSPIRKASARDIVCMAADSEHKEGAWSFLESMLGEKEEYNTMNIGFPVRKEALNQLIEEEAVQYLTDAEGNIRYNSQGKPMMGAPKFLLMDNKHPYYGLDSEQKEQVLTYLQNLDFTPRGGSKKELEAILQEELSLYFNGNMTLEESADHIQRRALILLNEGK